MIGGESALTLEFILLMENVHRSVPTGSVVGIVAALPSVGEAVAHAASLCASNKWRPQPGGRYDVKSQSVGRFNFKRFPQLGRAFEDHTTDARAAIVGFRQADRELKSLAEQAGSANKPGIVAQKVTPEPPSGAVTFVRKRVRVPPSLPGQRQVMARHNGCWS